MENVMPKFNFSGMDLDKSLDELLPADKGNKPKNFRPGAYDVVIKGIENKGASESDNTWLKLVVTLEGTDGRTITNLLMIPTARLHFNTASGKGGNLPATRLRGFVSSLGYRVETASDLVAVGQRLIENGASFIGMNIGIQVDYQGTHIAVDGKDAATDKPIFVLRRGNKDKLLDTTTGKPVVFSAYDAAKNYAETVLKAKVSYPEVVRWSKSQVENDLSGESSEDSSF